MFDAASGLVRIMNSGFSMSLSALSGIRSGLVEVMSSYAIPSYTLALFMIYAVSYGLYRYLDLLDDSWHSFDLPNLTRIAHV